jgi:hypothetical protein
MTKKETYNHYLMIYGITTIIMVLRHYESIEDYKECQTIIEFIREQETRLKIKLHTRLTTELKQEVEGLYKEAGLTGSNFINNSREYSKKVIDDINKLKEKVK